jgi:hypothetical protein
MKLELLFVGVPVFLLALGCGVANAESIQEAGAIVCVTDKWNEKEPEKGHKLVESAMRCVDIPYDKTAPKVSEDCAGNYEYKPDGSWKGSGTCSDTFQGGDKKTISWEEGSHLKEYTYTATGGTGKYKGVTGGGTYMYESLTDTLSGGWYKGTLELP